MRKTISYLLTIALFGPALSSVAPAQCDPDRQVDRMERRLDRDSMRDFLSAQRRLQSAAAQFGVPLDPSTVRTISEDDLFIAFGHAQDDAPLLPFGTTPVTVVYLDGPFLSRGGDPIPPGFYLVEADTKDPTGDGDVVTYLVDESGAIVTELDNDTGDPTAPGARSDGFNFQGDDLLDDTNLLIKICIKHDISLGDVATIPLKFYINIRISFKIKKI